MKAGDEKLGNVFDTKIRHEIPIFQRPYVWDEVKNWAPLWDDLRQTAERVESEGGESEAAKHELFLGAFVTQDRPPAPKRVPVRQVIDGQQRMTTLQVFMAAAHRAAERLGATDAADSFETLVRNRVGRDTDFPEDRFSPVPLPSDRAAFEWAVRLADDPRPAPEPGHRLVRAANWFEAEIAAWAEESRGLTTGSTCSISPSQTASRWWRSIWTTATIRRSSSSRSTTRASRSRQPTSSRTCSSSVSRHKADQALEHELHETEWKPLDGERWRQNVTTGRIKRARVDTLLAYWLSNQVGDIVAVEHLYADFKTWLTTTTPRPRAADVIVDLRRWADTMDSLLALPLTGAGTPGHRPT
ncbi:MAG: DUF262 domain-containing protein [Cellulomonas sp.]|uniref:DUF262 domain-containing protein n=1 Tax=Cellulomonas sp. TaxID=40001 RepID=UPI0025844E0E|nr:DUF262 domain-containing protein [Cellulomonas sp.]MCR6706178.1 DUF262 domain-containing protein [Cellulomonas sp.]